MAIPESFADYRGAFPPPGFPTPFRAPGQQLGRDAMAAWGARSQPVADIARHDMGMQTDAESAEQGTHTVTHQDMQTDAPYERGARLEPKDYEPGLAESALDAAGHLAVGSAKLAGQAVYHVGKALIGMPRAHNIEPPEDPPDIEEPPPPKRQPYQKRPPSPAFAKAAPSARRPLRERSKSHDDDDRRPRRERSKSRDDSPMAAAARPSEPWGGRHSAFGRGPF